jgi:hypothetical protein
MRTARLADFVALAGVSLALRSGGSVPVDDSFSRAWCSRLHRHVRGHLLGLAANSAPNRGLDRMGRPDRANPPRVVDPGFLGVEQTRIVEGSLSTPPERCR